MCEVVILAFSMTLGLLGSMILCPHPVMENEWATADKLCIFLAVVASHCTNHGEDWRNEWIQCGTSK